MFLFGCGNSGLPEGSFELEFDESVWKSPKGLELDENNITLRQKMLGDLVNNHLIGKGKERVVAMLGEPSSKMDPDGEGPSLSYPTGFERQSYMRIDSEWLLIVFDSSGIANDYSVGVD